MKFLFYDLETTGTKYWRNGIHQISGMVVVDGEVKTQFDYKVKPNPQAEIEDEALAIAGITREDLEGYEDMRSVYNQIVDTMSVFVNRYDRKDKMFLAGYNNGPFDNQFYRAFFVQNGDPYFGSWFWSGAIDVMVLALEYLKAERHTMENFKLMTVARKLGIEVDESKLHDAMYDIELTYEAYRIITGINQLDPGEQYETKPSRINDNVF